MSEKEKEIRISTTKEEYKKWYENKVDLDFDTNHEMLKRVNTLLEQEKEPEVEFTSGENRD